MFSAICGNGSFLIKTQQHLAKLGSQGPLSQNPPNCSQAIWPYFIFTEVLFTQKGRFIREDDEISWGYIETLTLKRDMPS